MCLLLACTVIGFCVSYFNTAILLVSMSVKYLYVVDVANTFYLVTTSSSLQQLPDYYDNAIFYGFVCSKTFII